MEMLESQEDVDRVLSYYTRQQVQFMDAKLGVVFLVINLGIVLFVILYIFIYKQGYLKLEQAKGAVVTHASGDALAISSGKSASRYFGIEELTYPGLENGNIFIATRLVVHRQERGVCEDFSLACGSNSDCTPLGKGTCTEAGYCKEHSWCNVDKEPEKYEMKSDTIQIWARSFIQFVFLAPERLFSTNPTPNEGNTFTVRQLLKMCKPIPINYEEVAELGAVFEVGFRWSCGVRAKKECIPEVNVRRLDTILDPENIGFGFKYPEYIDADHRVSNEARGLRFYFRTTGVGKKVSLSASITTGSTSAALLSVAIILTDLLLTQVFANRKKYAARKFENTPDFSDYMEKLDQRKAVAVKVEDIDKAEQDLAEKEREWQMKFQEDKA